MPAVSQQLQDLKNVGLVSSLGIDGIIKRISQSINNVQTYLFGRGIGHNCPIVCLLETSFMFIVRSMSSHPLTKMLIYVLFQNHCVDGVS